MKFYLIVFLLLITTFHIHSVHTLAQTEGVDCETDTDVFLFDYDIVLWQGYTQIIGDLVCDIDTYWKAVEDLPNDYQSPSYIVQEYANEPFHTPENFIQRTRSGACNIRPTFTNARGYYCPSPFSVVISEPIQLSNYLRWETNDFGSLNVALTLTHEWAHHVQLTSLENQEMPELQAECFVGAYFQHAVNNSEATTVDFSQDIWDAYMLVIPVTETETMVGDRVRWENISIAEQGLSLRLGFEEGLSACLMIDELLDI